MPQDPRAIITPLALGAHKQFLDQSPTACTPELVLVDPPAYMLYPKLVRAPGGAPYVSICLDQEGQLVECLFDPSPFAAIRIAVGLGGSIFLNDNGSGKFYAKMFGQMDKSAGLTVQRFICGSEEGETAGFISGNIHDFRFGNLRVGSGRDSRGRVDNLLEALGGFGQDTPEELFGGTVEARFAHYRDVLSRAIDRMDAEREEHFARRTA